MALSQDELVTKTEVDPVQYRAGVIDLLGRTLTLYYHGLLRYLALFGIGLMAMSTIAGALVYYLFQNPQYILFLSFDGFGFTLRVPILADLFIINVLMLILSTVVWSILEAPTTDYAITMYEQEVPTVNQSIINSKSRIKPLLKVRLVILFVELAIILPILALLILGVILENSILFATADMLSLMIIFIVGYIHVRLLPVAPIVLREDLSTKAAIQRCFNLSSGQFSHTVLGFITLLFFEFMVFFFIVNIFSIFGYGTIAIMFPVYFSYLLIGALRPLFSVVLYMDLRSRMKK